MEGGRVGLEKWGEWFGNKWGAGGECVKKGSETKSRGGARRVRRKRWMGKGEVREKKPLRLI